MMDGDLGDPAAAAAAAVARVLRRREAVRAPGAGAAPLVDHRDLPGSLGGGVLLLKPAATLQRQRRVSVETAIFCDDLSGEDPEFSQSPPPPRARKIVKISKIAKFRKEVWRVRMVAPRTRQRFIHQTHHFGEAPWVGPRRCLRVVVHKEGPT